MNIWERRNLAYFDRRQRLLAEERQRQQHQQQQQGGDVNVSGEESTTTDNNEEEEPQAGVPLEIELSEPLSSVQRVDQQEQQIARPSGFICAADDPQWREMTSHNIMGDYDPQRASRDPAYQYAWTSCQRLVNMRRSGVNPDDFIPTNPRLAALLEHRRRENARERLEEETALRQQQQEGHSSSFHQGRAVEQQQDTDAEAEGNATTLPGNMLATQATEYIRLNENEVHRLQRESQSQASSNSLKRSSSGSSREKRVTNRPHLSYYLALPYPTQHLTKSVMCTSCNCALYTTPVAMRFFCQTCGHLSSTPRRDDEVRYEEKMQDAEDQDAYTSSS